MGGPPPPGDPSEWCDPNSITGCETRSRMEFYSVHDTLNLQVGWVQAKSAVS